MVDSNSLGELVTNQLPGLLGVLQPAAAGAMSLNQAASGHNRQNLANAMLAAAAGLLTPSPNRYPLGPLQRLGAGLGAAMESYDRGPAPMGILSALEGRRGLPRAAGAIDEADRATRPMRRDASRGPRATAAAQSDSRAELASVARPKAAGARVASRNTVSDNRRLRKFNGSLGRRLDHPASLPGGWELYGYEKQSGHPVYVGPGSELRVYA
jgi:hypothetical protein